MVNFYDRASSALMGHAHNFIKYFYLSRKYFAIFFQFQLHVRPLTSMAKMVKPNSSLSVCGLILVVNPVFISYLPHKIYIASTV